LAILIDKQAKVLIQGITGRQGSFHARRMLDYGTDVVGGVTPGRGGEWFEGKPLFDTVEKAVAFTGATVSMIIVPAPYATDAIFEAVDAGINLIVCITEFIPVREVMRAYQYVRSKGARLIGPNCPGILSPGLVKVGIIPEMVAMPGNIGVISRSGTLTYEICYALSQRGIGQSTIVGIGADLIIGTDFVDILEMFENDVQTEKIVLIGEIGGRDEIEAAHYIQNYITKPVVAFLAGRSAPAGKRMGHSGAIFDTAHESATHKMTILAEAGVRIAQYLEDVPARLREG
jgi:succinyl-CoA synthetase alpha subunit